jgi:hypothetical protein
MIERGRLDGLDQLEDWFRSRGHRLEFELTRAGWSALIVPADLPRGQRPLLSAEGADPVQAARKAHQAFARASSGT